MIDLAFMQTIDNAEVLETFCKAERHLAGHERILCNVSGGSDSDIVIDILSHCEGWSKVHFVFFDTGVEYAATKRHLEYLEKRYNIKIERVKAEMPIPLVVKKYGQPLISKYVSDQIYRLSRHDFQWEDEDYETLALKYPKCTSACKWWAVHTSKTNLDMPYKLLGGRLSSYSVTRFKGLREFILKNPIDFSVSSKCCTYAKKRTAEKCDKTYKTDLKILGLRKAEGGIRASNGAYKSCYLKDTSYGYALYMPLFWWTDADKRYYEKRFDIVHSDCYAVYGMKRTGCAGCPFNRKVLDDLAAIKKYEPKLYKACTNMFTDSYEYTARFREFQKQFIAEEKEQKKASKFYNLLGDSDEDLH